MSERIQLEIINHQDEVLLPDDWIQLMHDLGIVVLEKIKIIQLSKSVLDEIEFIDVAIVNKKTSSKVHLDFMSIEGETDVITFPHGEIIICAEVARLQSIEHGEPLKKELFRYLVHGLLHLAGFDDIDPADQLLMLEKQEALVLELNV
jgi:probable rRNA maturation factor